MTNAGMRQATASDIVDRLADGHYEWTAVAALGWGLGDAQLDITAAVSKAQALGLIERQDLRGKPVIRLSAYGERVARLREWVASA